MRITTFHWLCCWYAVLCTSAGAATAVTVKDFGARGDGLTDDYAALQAAAKYICSVPGGTLVFPAGTYYIGQYKIAGGRMKNSVTNIRYSGCRNVTISGYGAKIDVFGAFARRADYVTGTSLASYSIGVTPFEMVNSSDFIIAGFEIDGNVDRMVRDAGVDEDDNAGIFTSSCRHYILRDLNIHHFHTDGIRLGGNAVVADQIANLYNIILSNNARQGLSIIQLRTAVVLQCSFLRNGRTGAYGFHDPAAGADVEPFRTIPNVDMKTGDITFDHCTFEDNLNYQFVSSWPSRVDSVVVRYSTIRAVSADTGLNVFLNAAANAVTLNNMFDIAAGHYITFVPSKATRAAALMSSVFQGNDCRFRDRSGLAYPSASAPVDLIQNQFTINSSGAEVSPIGLAFFRRVEGNTFFVSRNTAWKGRGTGSWAVIYYRVASVSGNRYTTDLIAPQFYNVVYYGSGMAISGEVYTASRFIPVSIQ